MIIDNVVHVQSRQEWREWLVNHHRTENYCWLVPAQRTSMSYIDFVEEALCFGWIDSTTKKVDDTHTAQRFSPRKKKSKWTELNKERVRRLDKLGFMTEAGHQVLPDMNTASFVIDEAILTQLRQDEVLYRHFQSLPELYMRVKLDNIQSVRNDATLYQNRLTKFIEHTRLNHIYGQWHDNCRLLAY
ncbi:YdeI/OmpD-associated family protein [Paenibacillus qinlingensis]|uniref:Uncharacterized protein YdeI (YjbR/CyaY-like superfamily) n=1 Tax=Paenibacillus qinlingensis TaxID=1837343 RepID=A0ABU1P4F8_9BACL|nr:YdeI/OmpD-associated family protein [Paenibacillus qinlingensis]MDR6554625.1 uncharacterized protein YdeI (YjbR/CyaY-like superfamily) [Paenibacillus qinlingensis]